MDCPQHLLEPLAAIVKIALLNIRVAAANGDTQRCHLEADHVHNLPSLMLDYSESRLKYYLDTEKVAFQKKSIGVNLQLFEEQWAKLRS